MEGILVVVMVEGMVGGMGEDMEGGMGEGMVGILVEVVLVEFP